MSIVKKFSVIKRNNWELYPFRLLIALIVIAGICCLYFCMKPLKVQTEQYQLAHVTDIHIPSKEEIANEVKEGSNDVWKIVEDIANEQYEEESGTTGDEFHIG